MSTRVRAFGIGMLLFAAGAVAVGLRHQRASGSAPTFPPATGLEGGI